MKIEAHYHQGLFRYLKTEWPVEPKYSDYVQLHQYYWQVRKFERKKKDYEAALASAIKESVPFEDQKLVCLLVIKYNTDGNLLWGPKEDTTYSFEFNGEVKSLIKTRYKMSHQNDDWTGWLEDKPAWATDTIEKQTKKVARLEESKAECKHEYHGQSIDGIVHCHWCGEPKPEPVKKESKEEEPVKFVQNSVCAKCGGKGYYLIGNGVRHAVQCTCNGAPYFIAIHPDSKKEESSPLQDSQTLVDFLQMRIRDAFKALESKTGSQFYPFDEMDLENLRGMKRAYSDVLQFVTRKPVE